MTEDQAQDHISNLYAAACGMLSLTIAAAEDAPARAAATLLLRFEPPPEVLDRLAAATPGATLFHRDTVAGMRQLARHVLAGRPSPVQN